MANNVFANNREISCKKGSGKTICCFPDVCFTPPDKVPPTPTGIPVPYPNTAKASDTKGGSKKVKISGKELMLKNKSYYKTSMGNEAGCAQKKGIVTSKTKGKAYFSAWSMNVKVEGQNVDRHLDLTTHNHGSSMNTGPWPNIDTTAPPNTIDKPCKKSCPTSPSASDKKRLRRKSPSSASRNAVNTRSPKVCAACGSSPSRLAADHIVPMNIFSRMPGFACLSQDNQVKIAETPSNFVGLCKSCNSSKCARLWHTWTQHKSRGLDFTSGSLAATRKTARTVTNKSIKNLKNQIKSLPCG